MLGGTDAAAAVPEGRELNKFVENNVVLPVNQE